ncbi:MAG: glycosyltransferase family 4 protein [Opitutales bacterium]|nr:glycosyltransferase family 4 protein [Opitutales bacterium]
MQKICFILNIAPLYRREIFLRLDDAYDCKFAAGEKTVNASDIKLMDESEFKNFKRIKNVVFLSAPFYWQKGVLGELFNGCGKYVFVGEPFCVSTWLFAIMLKFMPRKKLYFWTHGWYGREGFFKKILKKIFFGLSDGIFVYGDYARSLMVKEGFDEKKLFPIHNSLAYSKQMEIRRELAPSGVFSAHFKNSNKNIIFIGRLGANKKLDMIIRALAQLKKSGIFMNATLVGDGGERENLQRLAGELGVSENVWFYGACYDERENANLIYNADLCVSPGNVGLTAIHCLAFGCPVITHDNFPMQMPEFEAVEDGKTGAFFKHGSLESLVETVRKWSENSLGREEIRRNCFEVIDTKWNPNYQMEIFSAVFGK